MKKLLYISIILTISSCATRGYKVGDQIPEKHPYYQENKSLIFADIE